ncbi:HTH domain-containing protein [Halegenticoccus tardaugens]|uniref:HTH domain-containing protein n=1 Tax=Halegenticoccus tardaugens TaxID=2071624 RepID=UPI00100C2E2C|nr:HTH domain-containing protein [Halegenticoccus tardaugens]
MSDSEQPRPSVTLFVRTKPACGVEGYKRRVLERLTALRREGKLADYDVELWEKAIPCEGPIEECDALDSVHRRIERFERWAERHDASIDGAFRRREIHSAITDETYSVLSLPTLCLAAYEDDELRAVYPHVDGDETYSVLDFLEALGNG